MNAMMAPNVRCKDGERIVSRDGESNAIDRAAGLSTPVSSPVAMRVLCVDDNPVCLRLVREVLSRSGCEVECAASGSEAVSRAAVQRFDVLVTDHDMPGMNGLALVDHLRGTGFDGRIVVISASVGTREKNAYRAYGVVDILLKPFSPSMLVGAVHGEDAAIRRIAAR